MATHEIPKKKVMTDYLIQDKEHNSLPEFVSTGKPEVGQNFTVNSDLKIVASCNKGIVCCLKKSKGEERYQYYVGKPATQQWQAIPNSKNQYDVLSFRIGILLLRKSGDYLSFRISILTYKVGGTEGNYAYGCEVFDSDCWNWEEEEDLILSKDVGCIENNAAVSNGSYIFWKTSKKYVIVLKFCEATIKYEGYKLPDELKKNEYVKLMDCEGRLGFITLSEEGGMNKMEVCHLVNPPDKNKPVAIWEKKFIMRLEKHVDQLKYPCNEGFYNVCSLEVLQIFQNIVCYKKILDDSTTNTVRLDQLNDMRDVFLLSEWEHVKFYNRLLFMIPICLVLLILLFVSTFLF